MNLKINRLQHVGIPVTDIAISESFYRSLGFENVMAAGFEFNGGKGKVAMMRLKDIILEIYQMPENELAEIKARGNGHIDHIAFDVDDINQTYSELMQAGFNILEPEPVFLAFWSKGCKYFNITGPDGERLEFNQIL